MVTDSLRQIEDYQSRNSAIDVIAKQGAGQLSETREGIGQINLCMKARRGNANRCGGERATRRRVKWRQTSFGLRVKFRPGSLTKQG